MSKQFTLTGTPAEAIKSGLGTPLQFFGVKTQGFSAIRKEVLWTVILVGIFGYTVFSVIQSINYLGVDYYLRERKDGLIGVTVATGFCIFRIFHLIKLFSTQAEVFAKGFYLKHGSKEYAYEFKDIAHLQKAFFRGGNNQINSVLLILHLASGETIKIHESWTEPMIHFADALSLQYAQSKKDTVIEQFKKGEKIWFWLFDLDKNGVFFDEKELPWSEVSEIKKARSDRYLLVHDQNGKKLAKWDLNKILDEELLAIVLEVAGRRIG